MLFPTLLLWVHADAQQCEALFSFDNTNLTIQFTDQSTHSAGNPIISWFWDFDDGGTSTQQNPQHTFPEADRDDVNLTITTHNGCQSDLEIRLEICEIGSRESLGASNAHGQSPLP
jgi:PKD repeat protein